MFVVDVIVVDVVVVDVVVVVVVVVVVSNERRRKGMHLSQSKTRPKQMAPLSFRR